MALRAAFFSPSAHSLTAAPRAPRRARVTHAARAPLVRAADTKTSAPGAVSSPETSEPEVDLYRDTPLRYLGYANECGEAFAAWLPAGGVPATYALAIAYVLADTVDKTKKAYKRTEFLECYDEDRDVDFCVEDPKLVRRVYTAASCLDTLLWQLLASVFWPGSLIHITVAAVRTAMEQVHNNPTGHDVLAAAAASGVDIERILPTLIGLAVIPSIVHPIDNTVDKVLDASVRPSMLWGICGPLYGEEAGVEECQVRQWREENMAPGVEILGVRPEEVNVGGVVAGVTAVGASIALPPAVFALSEKLFGA